MKQFNTTGAIGRGRTRNAFTLIELLVVMAVILILGAILLRGYQYLVTESQVKACLVKMKLLAAALDEYRRDTGYYFPPSLYGTTATPKDWLVPKYCSADDFKDPWGSTFTFSFWVKSKDGRDFGFDGYAKQVPFTIYSLGPNRSQDSPFTGQDGIVWPTR